MKRWLAAPLQHPDGVLEQRDKGTPQGSAISPSLANLFMHYAFDSGMAREFRAVHLSATPTTVSCSAQGQKRQAPRDADPHAHRPVINDLADWLNPIIAGWMRYYGRFYRSRLYPLLLRVSFYLRRWAARKYRRLRTYKRFKRWGTGLLERQPGLFAHWRWVRVY
jgi:RNA-directed DNA polymerase